MPLEQRPMGSHEPLYSTQRDIALIFEQLAGTIPTAFASQNFKSWIGEHTKQHQLTEAQLQHAAYSFLQGLANFRDPQIHGVGQAFEASGFWRLSEPARLAVYAAMGMIITNAFYSAIRQQAVPEQTKHKLVLATPETVEAIEAGNAVLQRDQRKLDAMAKAKNLIRRITGR